MLSICSSIGFRMNRSAVCIVCSNCEIRCDTVHFRHFAPIIYVYSFYVLFKKQKLQMANVYIIAHSAENNPKSKHTEEAVRKTKNIQGNFQSNGHCCSSASQTLPCKFLLSILHFMLVRLPSFFAAAKRTLLFAVVRRNSVVHENSIPNLLPFYFELCQ